MKKILIAAVLLWLAVAQPARALSVTLAARGGPQVAPGGTLLLDVGIAGLQSGGVDSELGAFQMDIHFDPARFQFAATPFSSWGAGLGDASSPGEAFTFLDADTPGLVRFGQVSLLAGAALDALQGDGFRLATLAFYTRALPVPAPSYSVIRASDFLLVDGAGDAIAGLVSAEPIVILQVPEPSTHALFGAGLLALAWLARGKLRAGAPAPSLTPARRARPTAAPW